MNNKRKKLLQHESKIQSAMGRNPVYYGNKITSNSCKNIIEMARTSIGITKQSIIEAVILELELEGFTAQELLVINHVSIKNYLISDFGSFEENGLNDDEEPEILKVCLLLHDKFKIGSRSSDIGGVLSIIELYCNVMAIGLSSAAIKNFNLNNVNLAWVCLIEAATMVDFGIKAEKNIAIERSAQMKKTNNAKKAAKASHKSRPTGQIKEQVKKIWDDWQKKPHSFNSKAEFARYIQKIFQDEDKNPVIKDLKTITDKWCKEWEAEKQHLSA